MAYGLKASSCHPLKVLVNIEDNNSLMKKSLVPLTLVEVIDWG